MSRLFLFFKQFFKISYQEARGFSALLVVALVALFLIFFPEILIPRMSPVDPAEVRKLDSLQLLFTPINVAIRFQFDPNTVSKDSLVLLGFKEHIADRIVNYRDKGGRFRLKDDMRKIYGISTELVESLYQWIDLPEHKTNSIASKTSSFDINLATIRQLANLKMIGDVMAGRIIRYRDLLGGFVSKTQYEEVYGLSDAAIAQLTSLTFIRSDFNPRLIMINHSDFQELARHPYISNDLASDIVQYREVKYTIESEKVLAVFKSIDKSNFEKLILYLDFQ